MLTTPFLTDLDPRADVKGSRDPLGIQSIWTRFGRHVVGNLTTVTTSVRDFTTLLLGYYFAERIADEDGAETVLSSFLKWEQLAAYARASVNDERGFRGVERVRRALATGPRVKLSTEGADQILGNQKTYGLWGLYTWPARASGLLEVEATTPRLTTAARRVVEQVHLGILTAEGFRDGKAIVDLLRRRSVSVDVSGAEQRLVRAVARVLRPRLLPAEREHYRDHLLHGGPDDSTEGRQQQLAELLVTTFGRQDFAWSPALVGALAKEARQRAADWEKLGRYLGRIRMCETVMAPSSALFIHLLGLGDRPVNVLVKRLKMAWGGGLRTVAPEDVAELRSELGGGDAAAGERWFAIACAMSAGDYGALVERLVEQNRAVMAARGGAPWAELRDGHLKITFRDERGELPKASEVPELWRFSYFLDSLRTVGWALRGSGDG